MLSSYKYGGFFQRVVAMFVDVTVLSFVYLLLWLTGDIILLEIIGESVPSFQLFFVTMIVMNAFYFTYCHAVTGQTIGKRLFGLKVVRSDDTKLSLSVSLLRWIGYIPAKAIFCLGFIWIIFDSRKRGWHDYLADTIVIRIGVDTKNDQ
ncbi:MAG: RDD family protein [Deltaproteobacteria bacterium]